MTYISDGKSLEDMAKEVYAWTIEKGWADDGRSFGDEIALLHTELSEALEAYRLWGFKDTTPDGEHAKPEGVGSEFADILIRLLDSCARHNIDLDAEFRRKMDYNHSRSFRHGGKRL